MLKRVYRDSNYELLRIISMFLIVIWHVIQHSNILNYTYGVSNFVLNAIMFFIIIHVNLFMLITGYYQSKSTFKLKKLFYLILEIWFYNFFVNLILKLSGLVSYTNVDYLIKTSLFNINAFWYIKCYIIVYLLSPFFNILINKLDKNMYKRLILILLLVFSVVPYFTTNIFYFNNGFNVSQHILLYFIGAYIRKYDLKNTFLTSKNVTQKRIIYLSIFLICWFFNLLIYIFHDYLITLDSNILKYIGTCIDIYKYSYNNPIIILQALSIFMFFGTIEIKNNIINKISSLTLGIYFIHESEYLYSNFFKWIGLDTGNVIYGKGIIIKVIFLAIIVFVTCAIIEFLRQCLFKFLYKFKFVRKLCNCFLNMFHNLFKTG